ncbi:50S ribosomal protein L24 [Thermoplasmatales archaeon AK]|nr:50S ribosomal protein L24 [Thermoplasmatales archaeon AK]
MEGKVRVGLSRELRSKYGVRSFPVSEGDIVKIRSGSRRGEGGKVVEVNHSSRRIAVEGITIAKADGKQETFYLRPEKLVITKIDFSRQERYRKLQTIASIKNISIAEPELPQPEPAATGEGQVQQTEAAEQGMEEGSHEESPEESGEADTNDDSDTLEEEEQEEEDEDDQ